MSTTSSDSGQSDDETTPTAKEKSDTQPSGMPSEMQRQMAAARERMQKYHAVYKRPPEKSGG